MTTAATAGTVAADLAIVVACVVGLWYGASMLVGSAVRIARRLGLSELVIGLTIVAVGTSAPELVVSVDAALEGRPGIAVGNVVGSNVFNLGVILGGAAVLRAMPTSTALVNRDGVVVIVATLSVLAVLVDGTIARVEGLGLFGALVAYTAYLLWRGSPPDGVVEEDVGSRKDEEFRPTDVVGLLVGLGLVVASGHFLVAAASGLARLAGVSEWVIGVTIVAIGTSTPELATSLVAAGRGSHGVSAGNLLGSNVFNLFGVLGLAAVIDPVTIDAGVTTDVFLLVVQAAVVVFLLRSGRQLSRTEGGALVGLNIALWAVFVLG